MKVIIHHALSDEERSRITNYYRKTEGRKGLPRLATGKLMREFIADAVSRLLIETEAEAVE